MANNKPTTNNSLRMVDIKYVIDIVDSNVNNLTGTTSPITSDVLRDALQVVKGQQDNTDMIVKETNTWLRKAKKRKPLVFMLAGASGTGKSFTVETVCDALKDYKMVKLNMNEYQSGGDVWKLLGSATGHVGSEQESPIFAARQKTEKLVILFDEIEKAHESLFMTIMTLMEKGEMANGRGDVQDFKHSIIFFTTNLAMNQLLRLKKESIQDNISPSSQKFQDEAKGILKSAGLRAEISGRVNWLLVYNALSASVVAQICLDIIRSLGKDYGITINKVHHSYLEKVARQCAGNNEGARPIKRIVTRDFESVFQDAYEKDSCSPDIIYDIDDQLQITPSIEKKISSCEELLSRALSKIHGQQDNMKVITKKVVTWVHRPDEAKKPLVFMFAGSSGTGKTYTAETITQCLKSQGYLLIKLPMNEYKSESDTWKLLGSSIGYAGSNIDSPLFAARKKSDKLIINFDEVEKAHDSIFETIMTLMEKGELTNGRGEKYDFRNSIIIFTSNIAMNSLIERKKELLDAGSEIDSYVFQQSIKDILKRNGIKNEVCGRINLVFVYNTLGIDALSTIAIEEIRKLGRLYGLEVDKIPESLIDEIVTQLTQFNEGARPITMLIADRFEEMFQNYQNNI